MFKRILIYGIALILLVVVFGGLVGFNKFREMMIGEYFASMTPPPVTISAATVTEEVWPDSIDAIGTLSAVQGVEVAAQVSGIVKEIAFEPGQRVSRNNLLVQLDDGVEQADLALYVAQRDLATSTLQRTRALAARGNAAESALEEAQSNLAVAEAQMSRIQAMIEQKSVRAPFTGLLGVRLVNEGQFITAGQPIVTLQALDHLYIDFTVPEQRLPQLKVGQILTVRVDAYPDRIFEGAVTAIDPRVNASTRTVMVQGTLENVDDLLRPGIFARVSAALPERPGVITVPATAVTYSLYGDTVYRIVPAPEQPAPPADAAAPADPNAPPAPAGPSLIAEQVFVRIGQQRNNRIEILSGLAAGDQVVTSGQLKLQNGAGVIVDNTVDPSTITEPNAPEPIVSDVPIPGPSTDG